MRKPSLARCLAALRFVVLVILLASIFKALRSPLLSALRSGFRACIRLRCDPEPGPVPRGWPADHLKGLLKSCAVVALCCSWVSVVFSGSVGGTLAWTVEGAVCGAIVLCDSFSVFSICSVICSHCGISLGSDGGSETSEFPSS